MMNNYKLKNYNFRLIVEVVVLTIFGIVVIASQSSYYAKRQIIGLILGFVVMAAVSLFDYDILMKIAIPIYLGTLGLLGIILLPAFGHSSHGAQRWIQIGGFTFQPSEIAKILLIICFAYYFGKMEEKINDLKTIIKALLIAVVPLGLIFKQPDLSTTIVIFLVFAFMYMIAGLSYRLIGIVLAIVVPSTVAGLAFIVSKGDKLKIFQGSHRYQYIRIMAWLRPSEFGDKAIQQRNSKMAIGSGQLFGKGLYNSDVSSLKNGNFISESHTDFINAIVGESLGFVGCMFIIIMVLIICFECIGIAKRCKDLQGTLIATGVAALIMTQTFVNVGVTTGLLPNTGLSLPFISYGLTSLVSMYIGIGLVLNVGLHPAKRRTGGIR
ncbi:MAG: rod shape-determining protein RodA [Lachnospiraceae bacterium]|nr:rod shape-determining protein RodA [Lachnospiraceae bacterium]